MDFERDGLVERHPSRCLCDHCLHSTLAGVLVLLDTRRAPLARAALHGLVEQLAGDPELPPGCRSPRRRAPTPFLPEVGHA